MNGDEFELDTLDNDELLIFVTVEAASTVLEQRQLLYTPVTTNEATVCIVSSPRYYLPFAAHNLPIFSVVLGNCNKAPHLPRLLLKRCHVDLWVALSIRILDRG